MIVKPPGFLWIVILGVVGFSAGFFGPMIFVPESNQGPMVGIFLTGPGGVVLGLLLFLAMKFLPMPGRAQWRALIALCVAGTLAICLFVQPDPATRGYILEVDVTGIRPPTAAADEVIADWNKRIAQVAWAVPRAGWEQQMRRDLAAGPGVVVDAVLVRQREVKVRRKPWNRGQVFATAWQPVNEKRSYYVRPADRAAVAVGAGVLFIDYDSTSRIRTPDIWPPVDLEQFIGMSRVTAVPPDFQQLP